MFYIDGVQDDSIAVSVPSNGSAVIQNVSMDCFDGHTFSMISGPSPGATVEFKHTSDVSWTDIEHEIYDLSPFDGENGDFQIRFDPDAVSFEEIRWRKGPAETSYAERLTFNSVGVYFLGRPATFTPGLVLFDGEQATFLNSDLTFEP